MSNPWYEVVGPDGRLTQGDIIVDCPLLQWQLDDAAEGENASSERLFKAAKAIKADVVVMSQACDLEQGRVSDVVFCPCRSLPPYREHLSQSFARFFMRVELPIPITRAW